MGSLAVDLWESHHVDEPHACCTFWPQFAAASQYIFFWVQKVKRKVDSVDQQSCASCYHLDWRLRLCSITFIRMPLKFFLLVTGETSESSTIPPWWLMKLFSSPVYGIPLDNSAFFILFLLMSFLLDNSTCF